MPGNWWRNRPFKLPSWDKNSIKAEVGILCEDSAASSLTSITRFVTRNPSWEPGSTRNGIALPQLKLIRSSSAISMSIGNLCGAGNRTCYHTEHLLLFHNSQPDLLCYASLKIEWLQRLDCGQRFWFCAIKATIGPKCRMICSKDFTEK